MPPPWAALNEQALPGGSDSSGPRLPGKLVHVMPEGVLGRFSRSAQVV